MTGWHFGPMVAFDLETDGPDPADARIVTACIAVIDGTGQTAPGVSTWLLQPVRPIPAEAAAIHGVTTERAQADGQEPAGAVKEITAALADHVEAGAPVVAFNASYDLTVLDREAARHGVPSLAGRCADDGLALSVVDPFVLDKHVDRYRKGKRTLTACCEHYRVRLDGAHDASFDAVAAARLAWRIAQQYPALADMPLHELHELQVKAKADQDVSFAAYLRKQGDQARTVEEQTELWERAARIEAAAGHWPVLPAGGS